MFVLLNGKVPTLEQLRAVMTDTIPNELVIENCNDNEGNIEFDPMYIEYDDDKLIFTGYNGIWELAEFDVKNEEGKRLMMAELLEWVEDEFKWVSIDSLEYALNWHGEKTVVGWVNRTRKGEIAVDMFAI